VLVLWAIAGQLDVLGGRGFLMNGNGIPIPKERQIANPDYDASIGKNKFPVYAHYCKEPHASLIPKSILESEPYKIRSLIVQGASITTSWPNPYIWRKALKELEFLVCIDLQLTADCAFADIVLPATTGFEFESYCYYYCTARIREKMIDPVGESRPDYQILSELATRLGYGDLYPKNSEDVLRHFLNGTDLTVADWRKKEHGVIRNCHLIMEYKKWEKGLLRSDGKPGFETPSGKFEIASSVLEKYGYDGLPTYRESDETPVSEPELAQKYPLILGTGALKPDMKTCFRAIPSFMEKIPHPIIEMYTKDADKRGLITGDVVVVKTVRGEVIMRAYVTDNIVEGVVYAAVGGGGPLGTEEWKQSNVNVLTDLEQYDEISGFPVYKVLLCEVSKKKRIRKGAVNQFGSLGCSG
jgi:anaerobic selenocysteine-containing dehydrogenase